jgi:AraC family transcriptional regulator
MSEMQYRQSDDARLILQHHLVQTSAQIGWPNLLMERYQVPGLDLPAIELSDYLIVLHLAADLEVESISYKSTKRFIMPQGSLAIHEDQVDRVRWDRNSEMLLLWMPKSFVAEVAEEVAAPVSSQLDHHALVSNPVLQHMMLALSLELCQPTMWNRAFVEYMARAIALQLLPTHTHFAGSLNTVGKLSASQLCQIQEFIAESLDSNLGLNDLAAVVGHSPYHFAKQFKASTGLPPHQYIIYQRVKRAKELLRNRKGEMSIAEISLHCGFTDQAHLTRHFKRLIGCTPKQYQR